MCNFVYFEFIVCVFVCTLYLFLINNFFPTLVLVLSPWLVWKSAEVIIIKIEKKYTETRMRRKDNLTARLQP